MKLNQCTHCGEMNSLDSVVCRNCNQVLVNKSSELYQIKHDLRELKISITKQIKDIDNRILELERSQKDTTNIQQTEPKPRPVEIKKEVSQTAAYAHRPSQPIIKQTTQPPKEKKPSYIEEVFATFFEFLFGYFGQLTKAFTKVYTKYKNENKLPIFFMTLSGIVIFLFGFGFLFQYSFNNYFNDLAKVLTGFAISFSILSFGIKINKKYNEYSSALIGLSSILNYVTIYFLSSYFNIVSSTIGFTLILLNTALSIVLSLRYETKIVASLSLFGGALAPFYLSADSSNPLFYFSYFLLLILSSIYVANKINWKSQYIYALFLTYSIIEIGLNSVTEDNAFTWFIIHHVFMYTFLYFAFFNIKGIKEKLDNIDITLIVTATSLTLFNFYYSVSDSRVLGLFYIINAIPFMILALTIKSKNTIRALLFILASTFIAFSIPSLFNENLIGFMWSIESLLIAICGFLFSLPNLRQKGYWLLAFGIIGQALTFPDFFFSSGNSFLQLSFLNMIFLLVSLSIYFIIFKKYSKQLTTFEQTFYSFLREFLLIWTSIISMIVLITLYGIYGLNIGALIGLTVIYLSEKKNLPVNKYFGLTLFSLLLVEVLISIVLTNSFRFSRQKLYAQIAAGEVLILLWGLQYFFSNVFPKSKFLKHTKRMREIFYCIVPFLIIPITRKISMDYLHITIWFSVLISFYLFKRFKFNSLRYEFFAFYYAACALSLVTANELTFLKFSGLLVAIVLSSLFLKKELPEQRQEFYEHPLKSLLTNGIYFFICAFFVFGLLLSTEVALAVSAVALFLITRLKLVSIRHLKKENFLISKTLLILSLLTTNYTNIYNYGTVLVFAVIYLTLFWNIIQNSHSIYIGKPYKPRNRYTSSWKFDVVLFHITTLIFYTSICFNMQFVYGSASFTVLLILHSLIVMYQSSLAKFTFVSKLAYIFFASSLLKLFMYDLEEFTLVSKIIVFMILGSLLLGSAYLFQKLKSNPEGT